MLSANLTPINAQTLNEVNGIISSNVTLTKTDGPYKFGTVVVKEGATLTIEAGSSVFITGYLQVNGTLIAKGTTSQPIYFSNALSSASIRFSPSSINSVIEDSIINAVPILCSSSVTIKGSYLIGAQAQSSLYVNTGSPTVKNNTMKGSLDGYAVIRVLDGSPVISNNNLLGYGHQVNSNSTPSPFTHYTSQELMYGVYVTGASGGEITNNRCYGNTDGIKVESGTISVNGNTMHPQEYLALPSTQPLPPTSQTTTPTLPPYPLPSQSTKPYTTSTTPTVIPTINTEPLEPDAFNLLTIATGVIIVSVVIIALLVTVVVVLFRKNRK